jgi:hypothetical protein
MKQFVKFSVFSTADGKLLRTGACPVGMEDLQAGDGERVVFEEYDIAAPPVDTNPGGEPAIVASVPVTVTKDKSTISANGVDYITLSNIPSGSSAHIYVPDGTEVVDVYIPSITEDLEIDTVVKGEYEVAFSSAGKIITGVVFNAS